MAPVLTVAAKDCRQAEHYLQLAAGSFNRDLQALGNTGDPVSSRQKLEG
jgi:hypothetical protein